MLYSTLYRTARLLWPGGPATRRNLRQLEQNQALSKDELRAFQVAKLQRLVDYACKNVPFYHDLYRRRDIAPADIKSLADFERLPIITKQDIRANVSNMIARTAPKAGLIENHTGGSTGEPLHFFIDDSFWWENAANEFRVRGWHGVREGARMAWLWGDPRDVPDWRWKRRLRAAVMNHRFLNAFSLTEEKMRHFADMLAHWQPALIMGYATTLTLFARFLQANQMTAIRPKIIETTAEKLWQPQRELIEAVFQCPVIDHYSSREMGTMAYQCEAGTLHTLDDARHVEVIAAGRRAAPGQLGQVVVTSLNHLAMPFIRYANEDMALAGDETPCACGRPFGSVQELVGRTNDYLITAAGQFVHSEFFAYTLRARPEVFSYQVYQPDATHLDVKIVCRRPVSRAWLADIRQQIQARFGEAVDITLAVVDDIELTPAGKHRYIISDIKPDFVT